MNPRQNRAALIVLDSVGIGGAADADAYGDLGANTVGHIIEHAQRGLANKPGSRSGPLHIPNLTQLGLRNALHLSTGIHVDEKASKTIGAWGLGIETSRGKDTTSGHWEIAGRPVKKDFHYFPDENPAFPEELISEIIRRENLPGTLANIHSSGIIVLKDFGDEHVKTGKPIFYTSIDSVLQIAAHEEHFGLQNLYDLCRTTRELVDPLCVGRVIARPFTGKSGTYTRTPNRRDFSMPPFERNILDELADDGRTVCGVGKISDIFAHRGITRSRKATGINGTTDAVIEDLRSLEPGGLLFANIVEFDSDFGHRRDVAGYASALEIFDKRLPEIIAQVMPGDLLILTADHGNDPTWAGTDHTRENIPMLVYAPDISPVNIGKRNFADIAATLAAHLGITTATQGESFHHMLKLESPDRV